MTNLIVKIIDTHHPEQYIDTSDLTIDGVNDLIYQCKRLLEELESIETRDI